MSGHRPSLQSSDCVRGCRRRSGVHATLAGVAPAFFISLRAGGADPHSPPRRLEQDLHCVVALAILPPFAFANAGGSLQGVTASALLEPVPLGIATGLLVGKTLCGHIVRTRPGILCASLFADLLGYVLLRARLSRPLPDR
jgi:Na+/H+ antiporter NhaA